jgi:hypothetical protein
LVSCETGVTAPPVAKATDSTLYYEGYKRGRLEQYEKEKEAYLQLADTSAAIRKAL